MVIRFITISLVLVILKGICFLATASKSPSFNTIRYVRSAAELSKFDLPDRFKGTEKSVWVEFDQLASYKPLNLGSGFPDFYAPENLTNALADVSKSDNPLLQQYTRGFGHPRLVNAIAKLYSKLINRNLDPNNEVLITVGAYEALYVTLQGHTNPGDEWIIIEPFFDCYAPMIQTAGGIPRYIPLKPKSTSGTITSGDWVFDRKEMKNLFNEKTKGIIINTPHNPIGKVFTLDELQLIADLAKKWDTLVVSDEVYEHIVYKPYKHIRIATLPDMYERTITIGSAGKTFSITGWRIGWAYGPTDLLYNLRVVHENTVNSCATPIQEAIAIGFELEMGRLGQPDCYFNSLAMELLPKRDFMIKVLRKVGMIPTIPEGGYFMLANWSALESKVKLNEEKDENRDYRFTKWMTKNVGLQSIPPSAFYSPQHKHLAEDYVRYCFIKMETEVRTLKQELARTRDDLKAATKRCRELMKELDHRTAGHESERILRDQQLSKILRALLYLEARLKQEQKSIRQMLCEKDKVIRNQQLEITMLRRYTKNCVKDKRDCAALPADLLVNTDVNENSHNSENSQRETMQMSGIGKNIASLKCEIITRLNPPSSGILDELGRNSVKKTHSFAGSDISKASLTSSENTDASIITTTTEGSPSLLSTEGFCEGESTDVSPGSTLNKYSSRCTPTTVTDSENETTMIQGEDEEDAMEENEIMTTMTIMTKRRTSFRRAKGQKVSSNCAEVNEVVAKIDNKDDSTDCNFISENEEQDTGISSQQENEEEPIYVNACNETNDRNQQQTKLSRTKNGNNNNNNNIEMKIETSEMTMEDTSGNWYSDPDEDRLNEDVFRHNTYRPNSNHNSVLECVNQILLQDMEEEENSILPVSRRFKHRGRIVRFQPARLSDIESVGSEMERRNSEEFTADSKDSPKEEEAAENEASTSEDEFGMKIVQKDLGDEDSKDSKAIPLVIIEPKVDVEETRKILAKSPASNPPLKMERIEEKACLQMSARGLTIARNLDYEDIESLPEITTTSPTPPRTPPALPPKPQFRNNTLILKKIPSPSFLIDEKRQQDPNSAVPARRNILGLMSSSLSKTPRGLEEVKSSSKSSRSSTREAKGREEGGFWKNRFNHVRSSFQIRQREPDQAKDARVTNIVRHFEEFKIGEEQIKDTKRPRERHAELEHDFDIRQNFEEFNLDECNLSDDPDRAEGDGSERLSHAGLNYARQNEDGIAKDNNNVPVISNGNDNGNSDGETGNSGYDHFLEATGLSNKSILTPSRLLSNHKSMLKPKDVKYKSKIKATAVLERHGVQATPACSTTTTHVRHWTGPFV